MDASLIRVGSHVRVRYSDGETQFSIVADEDADVSAKRVSAKSPIARALIGHRPGDDVQFRAPDGPFTVTVVSAKGPEQAGSQQ
jgi:transcription elongation factor GreA